VRFHSGHVNDTLPLVKYEILDTLMYPTYLSSVSEKSSAFVALIIGDPVLFDQHCSCPEYRGDLVSA
jgi:hypothetical protein